MNEGYEFIKYDLFFHFNVNKDNNLERKIQLQKAFQNYVITKKNKTIVCKNEQTNIEIGTDYVRIITNSEEELFNILFNIKKIYNFEFNKFRENDFLVLDYEISNKKITSNKCIKYIKDIAKSTIKDDIISNVTILTVIDEKVVVRCEYRAIKNGIHIQLLRMDGAYDLKENIILLKDYLNNKVELFKMDIFLNE